MVNEISQDQNKITKRIKEITQIQKNINLVQLLQKGDKSVKYKCIFSEKLKFAKITKK